MDERYVLRSYVVGAAAARTGDEMSGPALLLAGLAITGSASTATLLLGAVTVSAAVGGPVFGVLLDRSPRPGRLLAVALGAYASALVLILLSIGRVPVVATLLIAVCAGLLGPALSGGWTAQLPYTVREKDLPRATALDAMTFNAAGLAGPAAAGAVAGTVGAPMSVIVSATLLGAAVPAAWRLPVPSPSSSPSPVLALPLRPPARTPLSADIRAGFRAIVRTPPLARATAVSVISCVGQGMFVACTPLLGERVFGAAGHGVLLLSGVAASALLANAVLAQCPRLMRRPDSVLRCGTLVLAVAFLLAATGRPVPLTFAALIAGLGEGPQLAALFAIRHREAPGRLRAQIFTTGASLKITAFALGAALTAPLATRSLPVTLLSAAVIQAFAALSYGSRVRRKSPGQCRA
ncbi:MFS transporter [Streptomyces sp. GMY02]|uniref:MFS transporter n=1 Tax=Streptomyces sp. GMY02 TaxID=1333528 RepID=UPI001C2C9E30|nr:MFS transporter [Streptomyces sp. GMY02]QXE36258.1 MFS transporter [Streptomyces sp. GMY02]